jgi:uncharacterized protein YjbI with pentapeptide repeats
MNSLATEVLNQTNIPIKLNDQDTLTTIDSQDNKIKRRRRRYTCFEWTQLIATISIPLIIGIYTIVENRNSTIIADANRRSELEIANISRISEREIAQINRLNEIEIAEQSREKDRALATDQQLEDILVEYQNFLSPLILDNGIALNKSLDAKVVAHFKTLTALQQLDTRRKRILIRSIYDAKLITLNLYSKSNDRAVLDLRGMDLTGVIFGTPHNSSNSYPANRYIDWRYLWLPESVLINVSFRHARLDCATFNNTYMDSADLSFAAHHRRFTCFNNFPNISAYFERTSLVNASLYNANFINADFSLANLALANMRLFSCAGCIFFGTKLFKADLSSSTLNILTYQSRFHLEFYRIDLREAVAHSANFDTIHFNLSDWSNVQASKININNCKFSVATMVNCSFVKSTIQQSIFDNATLDKIDFSYAIFKNVTFINSNMRYTNLSFIKCTYCHFINVTLQGTVFKNATLQYSNFNDSPINTNQLEEMINIYGSRFFNGTIQLNISTIDESLYQRL